MNMHIEDFERLIKIARQCACKSPFGIKTEMAAMFEADIARVMAPPKKAKGRKQYPSKPKPSDFKKKQAAATEKAVMDAFIYEDMMVSEICIWAKRSRRSVEKCLAKLVERGLVTFYVRKSKLPQGGCTKAKVYSRVKK